MRRADAHPAAAPAAAAHPSEPAQASLDVSQVRRGRAAGHADAALAFSEHEAAPASSLAERVRRVSDAAAARLHCRTAADDVSLTAGSDTSGSEDCASESDYTAGAGLHAGGQAGLLPAVLPCLGVLLAPRAFALEGAGGNLALGHSLTSMPGRCCAPSCPPLNQGRA